MAFDKIGLDVPEKIFTIDLLKNKNHRLGGLNDGKL